MSSPDSTDLQPLELEGGLDEQRISRIYAESVLNAALKRGVVDEVEAELRELVEELFRSKPEFEEFLSSSAIGTIHKTKALRNLFEGKSSQLFYNLLRVLNEHGRLSVLRSVYASYKKLNDLRSKRIPVWVTTAVPFGEDQTNRLLNFLRNTLNLEPVLHTIIDPDILGGMIVRLSDWVYDASVRNELVNLRKQLMARSSHEIQSGRDRFSNTGGN